MSNFIPYGKQWLNKEEIEAVTKVLQSDWITQGPKITEFENKIADYCGADYAIAVSSGTAALHIAALASGLSPGDEGITSPNTFLASSNCIAYCGSVPHFADILPETFCINPKELKKQITAKTRVVIPVHFAGQPCDMEAISHSAKQNKLTVIEDAAHALGSQWKDKKGEWHKVGSCSHSHMTIFSFHPVKTITTGEGGMILTNSKELAEKCRLLSNHGITKDSSKFTNLQPAICDLKSPPPWYYEMQRLGFNYRITDLQAALGLVQLKRLPAFIKRRREIHKLYNEQLTNIGDLALPQELSGRASCWHLYVLQTDSRDTLLNHLHDNNIGAHAMYIPVHLQPYYQDQYGYKKGDFPKSETYFKKSLVLPLYPQMTNEMVNQVIDSIEAFYG